jgi:hypothetical protein
MSVLETLDNDNRTNGTQGSSQTSEECARPCTPASGSNQPSSCSMTPSIVICANTIMLEVMLGV